MTADCLANPNSCGITKALAPYRPPLWLPGRHLQTIYSAKIAPRDTIKYRRERWNTPDGDFVDLDFVDGRPDAPFLILFHGMEGSSDSHYARAIMAHIKRLGWSGVVPHFRSCSGEINLGPRLYHCADYEYVDWIMGRLRQRLAARPSGSPSRPVYAAGASLGGSVLLHWLANHQEEATAMVAAACAICAPLDVMAGARNLDSGVNKIYGYSFMRTLKPKALAKLEQHAGLFDGEKLLAARTVYDFDSIVTAPIHGFLDVEHYWQAASAARLLPEIRTPTLLINTQNDPCVPASSLPRRLPDIMKMELLPSGGHLGFIAGGIPGRHQWLPARLIQWFLHGR